MRIDDPVWNREQLARLEGDTAPGKFVNGYVVGKVHGVRDGEAVRDLMGFEVYSSTRVLREQLPEHMRDAWDRALQLHGDTTFIEVFGHAPQVYDWYLEEYYRKLFYSGRIERSVVEPVRLRLANVHGCAFCNRSDTLAALALADVEKMDSCPYLPAASP